MKEWLWKAEEGRAARARKIKFETLDLESDDPSGTVAGSGAKNYQVTLSSCTCADFFRTRDADGNQMACKHMIALGMKLGLLNENGLTPAQQAQAYIDAIKNQAEAEEAAAQAHIKSIQDRLAAAYGYYCLFDDRVISDAEYDSLKAELTSLIGDWSVSPKK